MCPVTEAPVPVEADQRTRWYTDERFGDLSISTLNSLDPATSRIDIALPLEAAEEVQDQETIMIIQEKQYRVFRIEIYRVGAVVYAQGYKDPSDGKDIPLTSLADWFSVGEHSYHGSELIGITQQRKTGRSAAIFDRAHTPVFAASPDGGIQLQLQTPDILIDPERIQGYIERTTIRPEDSDKKAIGAKLLLQYGTEYLERIEANDLEWSHQPAVAAATGMALITHEESAPKQQFKGWVSSPTGSGKTEMEMQVMETAQQLTDGTIIFVTSRSILLDQIQKKLEDRFGSDNICRYDQEDKRTDKKIIITTYHSAIELFNALQKRKADIPVVVWDEAHNLLQQRKSIVQHKTIQNSMQFAYTATGGLDYTLTDLGFQEIINVPLAYTIETGVTPPIAIKRTVLRLDERLQAASEKAPLTKIEEALIELELSIQAKLQNFFEESVFEHEGTITIRPTFIEVDSIEEGKVIEASIKKMLKTHYKIDMSGQVGFIHSNQSKAKNTQIVENAIEGHIHVIVGVNMISEGLDIPKYEVIILKPWRKSEYRPFQDMGRVMRKNENGNPCLVIEIWPFDDADIKGYRSALQIIGVSKGDPRVSFRNQKQYTKEVGSLAAAMPTSRVDIQTERAYKTPLQFTIRSTRAKRERGLVGISEFQQIANLIIPKYRDYLSTGGDPIIALQFSKRSDQMKLYPNPDVFETIVGFRWWLLPYFRLDADQIQSLAKLMYEEEVAIGLKKPYKTIETAEGLHAYIRDIIKTIPNPLDVHRSVIVKNVSRAFQQDFSIKSMEYTVLALVHKLIPEDARDGKITLPYFLDKIRFLMLIDQTPANLQYLIPRHVNIESSMESVFQYVYREIERRVTAIITNLDSQMKGYVHSGANIDSDVFHARYGREIREINDFIDRIYKVTSAIRFDTSLLRSSRRGVKIVNDIYGRVRTQYPTIDYAASDESHMLQLMVSRLKTHNISKADDVPTVFSTNFDLVFGIPYRSLDVIAQAKNLSATGLLSHAARMVDPEYQRSYDMYITSLDPNVVAKKIATALVAAKVEVTDVKADTLLTLKHTSGSYILPRIYVDAAFLSRSDGRTRAALKNYTSSEEILNINMSEFMSMIKTEMNKQYK